MVIASERYKKYEETVAPALLDLAKNEGFPITQQVNIKAVYYMPTKRRVDLCNLHEALCDVLVKYGILEDDNSKIVFSMDGSFVDYDKENPRTEIEITYLEGD